MKKKTWVIIILVCLGIIGLIITSISTIGEIEIMQQLMQETGYGALEKAQERTIDFTPTTDKVCQGGICTLTLWSGTRNVYEDNEWKRVENARSLKDKSGLFLNISLDPSFNLTIGDYNYTYFEDVCFSSNITGRIPLKVYRINKTNSSHIINEFDVIIPNPVPNRVRCFNFTLVRPIFAYTIRWGFNSTTIMLQDNVTENLGDTYIASKYPTTNYGTWYMEGWAGEPVGNSEPMIKFNITAIPDSVTIDNATLWLHMWAENIDNNEEYHLDAHHYYNQSWIDTYPTWNNMVNETNYNTTYDSRWTVTGSDPTPDAPNWVNWTVTNAVNRDYTDGNDNCSIWIRTVYSAGSPKLNDEIDFNTREYYEDIGDIPYLNITYSEGVSDSCTCPENPAENWEVDMSDDCTLSSNCDCANLTFINTGTFTCNATLNASSVEGLGAGQIGYVTGNCRGIDR